MDISKTVSFRVLKIKNKRKGQGRYHHHRNIDDLAHFNRKKSNKET